MNVSQISNQSNIKLKNPCCNLPSFTATAKHAEEKDTFKNRFKDEYKKETKTPLGKILFWGGSIGLAGFFVGEQLLKSK